MASQNCFVMTLNQARTQNVNNIGEAKPSVSKEKVVAYEEKSVGSTPFYQCEACPYMALAEDDIKFHLFTVHPDMAKSNGLANNIQIPCPGCNSVFDAEETLRNHLRNHHKMGIKDIKKMIKSLVQIALKNAKFKKESKREDSSTSEASQQPTSNIIIPQVIEIVPDIINANSEVLPKGVQFISVDELQKMSTPNFEKVDPKDIIQEASINIVYTNDISTSQYVNVSNTSTTNTCSIIQVPSVTPDLISSIPTSVTLSPDTTVTSSRQADNVNDNNLSVPICNKGRPIGSRNRNVFKTDRSVKETELEEKLGVLCKVDGCHVRLKDSEKLKYHQRCHQNGKLMCLECSKVFATVDSLHTHLWKMHAVDLELQACNVCDYRTYKKHRLHNIHMKCHGTVKAYTCSICSKAFKNLPQLTKHRVIHKKDSNPSQCDVCERQFSTERRLRIHVQTVHEKIRPFKCCHCDYTAPRKEDLKLHIRTHTDDKPYECNDCTYKTGDHNAFRRHRKMHTKESLYTCKYCPYTTIQSNAFASHMISKHPNTSSGDVHKCPYCNFISINRDNYIAHLHTHPDKEGVKLYLEITKNAANQNTKPRWNIPSENEQTNIDNPEKEEQKMQDVATDNVEIPIEVYDCDSQQESMPQDYPKNYSTHETKDMPTLDYTEQTVATNLSKDGNNSDCLISESSEDTIISRHQYSEPRYMVYNSAPNNLHFLNTTVSMEQNILQNTNVNSLASIDNGISNNIMSNFPIRLPLPVPSMMSQLGANHITLKPVDKIHLPVTKVTGPIIKPTQILPVPSSSNSPVNIPSESEGVPRKKPKISVKSNLILKGPDQVNMFHSQQKMAFRRLEDNERFGLDAVTFNNLITTQFMQLPPEPVPSESPNDILPYPQETMLGDSQTAHVNSQINNPQIFNFNQQMDPIPLLPPQQKIPTTDPSYIKIEASITQNTQSPSLERMCNANSILNNQSISLGYKASPPLEDLQKTMNEIKREVKSDAFYTVPLSNAETSNSMMDQYLMDNMIGEQYAAHMDLSASLPDMNNQQNDVIEIDDNSDDTKLLPRFDMNFPLEQFFLMHNDYFTENEMQANGLTGDIPVSEMNRMVAEVPLMSQKDAIPHAVGEGTNHDFVNQIQGKRDPMMNTSVRPCINKINVKNIELMKN